MIIVGILFILWLTKLKILPQTTIIFIQVLLNIFPLHIKYLNSNNIDEIKTNNFSLEIGKYIEIFISNKLIIYAKYIYK